MQIRSRLQAVEEALILLLDHLMYITRPDGTTPFFGDDDGGRLAMLDTRGPNDFRPTLATGAALFSRGDYKFVAGDASDELLWLLGPEGLQNTMRSSHHARPSFHARSATAAISSCVTVGRTNQTTCSSTVDHTARSTADMLMRTRSFELAANGRTVLVDPGTYTYTGSKELRDWFRSHAHNTSQSTTHHLPFPMGRSPGTRRRVPSNRVDR